MDAEGPRNGHTKWSQSEKDSIIYVESKKNHDANELICKTEIDSQT